MTWQAHLATRFCQFTFIIHMINVVLTALAANWPPTLLALGVLALGHFLEHENETRENWLSLCLHEMNFLRKRSLVNSIIFFWREQKNLARTLTFFPLIVVYYIASAEREKTFVINRKFLEPSMLWRGKTWVGSMPINLRLHAHSRENGESWLIVNCACNRDCKSHKHCAI